MSNINQRLDLRQAQNLVMTPQLQQAIKLLQLNNAELAEYIAALETEQDAALSEGLTGDVLAVEFQSYLRHRGH